MFVAQGQESNLQNPVQQRVTDVTLASYYTCLKFKGSIQDGSAAAENQTLEIPILILVSQNENVSFLTALLPSSHRVAYFFHGYEIAYSDQLEISGIVFSRQSPRIYFKAHVDKIMFTLIIRACCEVFQFNTQQYLQGFLGTVSQFHRGSSCHKKDLHMEFVEACCFFLA